MAYSSSFPDIWTWLNNLPPIIDSISTCIFSPSSSQPSLKLSIFKIHMSSSVSLSISVDYNTPIILWTSKAFMHSLQNRDRISTLLKNIIKDILHYSPTKNRFLVKLPKQNSVPNIKEILNFSFLTLTFIICIYEAPSEIRYECLNFLKDHFACVGSREVSKMLMRMVGSNTEEHWMRSVNLAITNWMSEVQEGSPACIKAPSSLFSYALSSFELWKVQLYCPLIAMEVEKNSSVGGDDERLGFSLNYHQLEGVIQLNYKVIVKEKWIDVMVTVDNIRCDIIRLVNETLLRERGAGKAEKHFPSRISLQLTPTVQTNILSISVSKSSENPMKEIGIEKTIEGSFDPSNPYIGLRFAAGETVTTNMKPWKFEQSVYGNTANLNWFLHDSADGREVFSSKPSKFSLLKPNAWFKNRYSNVHRPFTRQGGVVFARDEYGQSVWWRMDKGALGKSMEWEIKGWVWLTYWPNKHRTFYTETRRLEFREVLHITLA